MESEGGDEACDVVRSAGPDQWEEEERWEDGPVDRGAGGGGPDDDGAFFGGAGEVRPVRGEGESGDLLRCALARFARGGEGRTELWPSGAEKGVSFAQLSREMTTSSFVLEATTKNLDEGCQTTSTVYSDLGTRARVSRRGTELE